MKVLIVGCGISGMSAGVYARRCGFDTEILEMGSAPGGFQTSWRRKGYLFEGGMHWLTGSSEKVPMHRIWKETGALRGNNPVHIKDPFIAWMGEGGPVCLYRDTARLREHLLSVSPDDSAAIETLVDDINTMKNVSMPVSDLNGVRVAERLNQRTSFTAALPKVLGRVLALNKMKAGDYVSRFRHPGIREILAHVVNQPDFTATSPLFTLGCLAAGDGGYAEGGSMRMSQNMESEFRSLGGKISYGTKALRVLVKNGIAHGVEAVDVKKPGEPFAIEADAVVVTIDTRMAMDTMFEEPLPDAWLQELRKGAHPLNCSFVGLGVAADLSELPETFLLPLKNPYRHGNLEHNSIAYNHYSPFKGYAPKGGTSLTSLIVGDSYDEWAEAKANGTYMEKKEELARFAIRHLEECLPQTRGKVDVWDVATPLTYERYCGSYRGSWMTVTMPGDRASFPQKPETVEHAYFAGQRIIPPGGLPIAAYTGRRAIQYICRDFDADFV
jgi:phytoene dehydrogenase-like protein